jgi:hypothetical protein
MTALSMSIHTCSCAWPSALQTLEIILLISVHRLYIDHFLIVYREASHFWCEDLHPPPNYTSRHVIASPGACVSVLNILSIWKHNNTSTVAS